MGSERWLATRRFPLEQREKVRLIDDALRSGLNSAFRTSNKLTLFDGDTLVAMVVQLAQALNKPLGKLRTAAGDEMQVDVSTGWSRPFGVLGRTLDWQSAYIVVHDPHENCPKFFISSALMFKSTAAVHRIH